MANIKEYNAGALGLQIPETGIEATAQAARRVGAFYNQAGEAISNVGQRLGSSVRDAGDAAVGFVEHREKSAGAATLATRLDDADKQWNDILKDPKTDGNDPSVANNFRTNTLEPMLQEWQSGFITKGGQEWAENHVAQAREHFFKKTATDQARLSGAAAINNIDTVVGKAATSVYNDSSGLDFQLGLVQASVMNTSPTMSPETHEHLMGPVLRKAREQIVQSAFHGEVTRDPNRGEEILDKYTKKYGEYFKPADSSMFATYVKQQQKRADAEERAADTDARRVRQDNSLEATYEWINKLTDENGNIRPDLNKGFLAQMQRDRRLLPSGMASVTAAFNRLKESGHAEHDAPGLLNELTNRVMLKPDDPRFIPMDEVARQHVGKDLTTGSYNFLARIAKTSNSPETKAETAAVRSFSRVLSSVFPGSDPFLGIKDPAMGTARNNFEQWFWPEYYSKRSNGIDFRKLFSNDDPDSLMNNFDKFKPSPRSVLDSLNERSTPKAPPPPKKPATPSMPIPLAPTEAPPTIDIRPDTFENRFTIGPAPNRPALNKLMQDYMGK